MYQLMWMTNEDIASSFCLSFGFADTGALFRGQYTVSWLNGGAHFPERENLAVYGVSPRHQYILPASIKPIETGRADEGTLRDVFPIINNPALPFRAGLTIHRHQGTWSSLPHKFEAEEILLPRPRPFYERFAYITKDPGGQGLQVRTGHLFTQPLSGGHQWVNDVEVVRDRDILNIPLGAHPVTALPGVRLGYFWLYWGDLRNREKFENEKVV